MFRTPPTTTAAGHAPSLRVNFSATLAGNVAYAAGQWAVLSAIAKLGGGRMLGEYALALAVATPVALFAHLNLRAVLATDVGRRHPFGDYLAARLASTALGLVAIALLALMAGYRWPVPQAIVIIGLALSVDNVSDLYFGLLQRREAMGPIARSMAVRGLLSAGALAVVLWWTGSLLWALTALAGARLLVLLAHDCPVASRGEPAARTGVRAQAAILRAALPLGIVLMLASLTVNVPRYAIESRLGTAELGAFAAVASFLTVGSTVMNALGQSAMSRLARHFSAGELKHFRALAWKLAGLALLLGAAGVLAAFVLGRFVLALLYRPDYAPYSGLLAWIMAAGVAGYIAGVLGYVVTSVRSFNAQVPLLGAAAAAAAVGSWALVPRLGLHGAALALALAWAAQIAGQVLILRRALARRECAR